MVDLVLMACDDGVLCVSGLQIWWTKYLWFAKMVYFVLLTCKNGGLSTYGLRRR